MFRNLKRGRIPFFFVLLLLCTCNSCFLFNRASVSNENSKQKEEQPSAGNDEDFQLQMIKDPSGVNKIRQAEPEAQKRQLRFRLLNFKNQLQAMLGCRSFYRILLPVILPPFPV